MGLIGSDDRIHSWRYYYLGPKGFQLGSGGQLTYFGLLVAFAVPLVVTTLFVFRGLGLILAPLCLFFSGRWAKKANRGLTGDRGVKHVVQVFKHEVSAPRPRARVSYRRD